MSRAVLVLALLVSGVVLAQQAPRLIQPISLSGSQTVQGDLTVNGDAGAAGSITARTATPGSQVDLGFIGAAGYGYMHMSAEGALTTGNYVLLSNGSGETSLNAPASNGVVSLAAANVALLACTGGGNCVSGLTIRPAVAGGADLGTTSVPWASGFFAGQVRSDVASGSNGFACNQNGCRIDLGTGLLDYLRSDGAGIIAGNYFVAAGAVESQAASGANAFAAQVNGARIDLGTGALDYLDSDGANVRFGGSVSIGAGALTVGQSVASPTYVLSTATATARNSTANPWTFDDPNGAAHLGVATASLTACNSTAPNVSGGMRGSEQFDTTKNAYSYCNGTRWVDVRGALRNTGVLDFPSIALGNSANGPATITVTGAADGQPCNVGASAAAWVAGVDFSCYVSAANTVAVRALCNSTTTACDPASATFTVDVTQ